MAFKLRAVELEDADLFYEWENDMATWEVGNTLRPFSRFALEQYVMQSQNESFYAAGQMRLMVDVEDEEEFSGNGVSYCAVCDAAFYKDKITVVTGGGDTALGDALLLSRFCKKVYLVHRRDSFRAGRALQNRVFATENIEALTNATVSEINGDTKVTSVTLLQNGEEKQLDCNGVFVAVGSVPDTKPLANLVKTDKYGYIIADESGKTSADGIFAGGDIRTKALRQVVTAVSDGANCVISAEKYLDEKQ